MSYLYDNTICAFTNNGEVLSQVKMYAAKRKMEFYIAEEEQDLIAVPYWLLILDAQLLQGPFLSYLEQVEQPSELIISHTEVTNPGLINFIKFNSNITVESLLNVIHKF